MRIKRRAIAAAAVLTAGALLLAGCSSSGGGKTSSSSGTSGVKPAFNAAVNGVVNPSTKQGGTLNLLTANDCDSWDPANTYYGWCFNMQRLMSRTLIGYSKVNGSKQALAPDLATNMGVHNANYTKWTYTLKPGIKFSNGKAITPADFKYAAERLFATDVINGGPTFYYIGLIGPSSYKGPYKGGDLNTITTTGNTITFNLSKPYADFNYLLALPTLAPVPANVEGGAGFKGGTYTKKPVSSGPFVISSYTPQKSVTFTRNKYWKQSTDTIHKPLVNQVNLTVDTDPSDIDQKLKAGTADARADINIGATFQSQVLTQPKLKANADDPTTPFTRYLVLPSSVIPNKYCREAIQYATDKAGLLAVFGGSAAGVVAKSMTPPGLPGYQANYDPYPSGSDGSGDVAKAKAALVKCGKPNGFSTKMAYATPAETGPKVFQTEKAALARVGIKITPATSDATPYYKTFIGSPSNIKSQGLGILLAAWGADFPTGYGFYNSITNGNAILPVGNTNYGSINNKTVNSILDSSLAGKTTEAQWQQLNHALMEDEASLVPFIWGKSLYYRNPRMTNVTSNNALAFGIYDFVNVGVSGS